MDKIKKFMSPFLNINSLYFKINFFCKKTNQNITENIDKYLASLEKEDFKDFLNNLGLFIQSYNISFMTNSTNQYFLKIEILQPSLKRLIQNRSIECIYPDCDDIILNKKYNLCEQHLNDSIINDVSLINSYLDQHIKKTKEIYNNYSNQKNIFLFLKNKYQHNSSFVYLSDSFRNINCILELLNYDDMNNINNDNNLIEIELPYKFDKRKINYHNVNDNDNDNDNDDVDYDSSSSESESESVSVLDSNIKNEQNDLLIDVLTNNTDNLNESYQNIISRFNEIENNKPTNKTNDINDFDFKTYFINQSKLYFNNEDINDVDDVNDVNDVNSDVDDDVKSCSSYSTNTSRTSRSSNRDSIFNSDSDLSDLEIDSDVNINELNELSRQLRMFN